MTIKQALVVAGFMLLIGVAARTGFLGVDTQDRAIGVIIGLVLAVFANELPKKLPPLTHGDPVRIQKYQRFAGWTFMLAGLGSALVWLVAPIEIANPLSIALVLAGVGTAGVTCLVARAAAKPAA
jgi:hypothetical protein